MASGRGAQARGHEIPLDSLSDLGPPQPQALLSSLENWCKTQPGSLPGQEVDPMNPHNLNPSQHSLPYLVGPPLLEFIMGRKAGKNGF